MEVLSNKNVLVGLAIAFFSVFSVLLGAPAGFEGFSVPISDILLQCNLCSGFVFMVIGVMELNESPLQNVGKAQKLMGAAFALYAMVCLSSFIPHAAVASVQLFLFAFSIACVLAGWARVGLSMLREFSL